MQGKERLGLFIERHKDNPNQAYNLAARSIQEIFDTGYYTYKDLAGTGSDEDLCNIPVGKIAITKDKENLGTLWVDENDEDEYVDLVEILKEQDSFSRLRRVIEYAFVEPSSDEEINLAINTLTELGLQTLAAAFILVTEAEEEIVRMYYPKALIPVLGPQAAEGVANHVLLWKPEKATYKAIRERFRKAINE